MFPVARTRLATSARPLVARSALPQQALAPALAAGTKRQQFSTSSPSPGKKAVGALLHDEKNGFGFTRSNPTAKKPRTRGVTEIRGPYYAVCYAMLFLVSQTLLLIMLLGDGR